MSQSMTQINSYNNFFFMWFNFIPVYDCFLFGSRCYRQENHNPHTNNSPKNAKPLKKNSPCILTYLPFLIVKEQNNYLFQRLLFLKLFFFKYQSIRRHKGFWGSLLNIFFLQINQKNKIKSNAVDIMICCVYCNVYIRR